MGVLHRGWRDNCHFLERPVPGGEFRITRDKCTGQTLAIGAACLTVKTWRLDEASLYVTLEPCHMCAGAMVLARIDRLVFGADDPKAGAVGSLQDLSAEPRLNHRFPVERGVLGDRCGELLRDFFRTRRMAR